jgi:transaldolase/glucokinase
MNRVKELSRYGQSVWLDFIRRGMLASGELARLIDDDGIRGVTSNPAIFEKAIAGGGEYQDALADAARGDGDSERIYERVAFDDIRAAADRLAHVHQASAGRDGFVSLEVAPRHAHDTARTIDEARRLWEAIARPNLMIKVPATAAGLPAIETLVAEGVNVNATLLFSIEVYERVAQAYRRGLARRVANGADVARVASVASFFVSRIDTLVDAELERRAAETAGAAREALLVLRGRAAIACAKLAYERYAQVFSGAAWDTLASQGAAPQRLLWASTGTKNPVYPDTMYVDALIGPDTVTTLPPATLDAFRDHGRPAPTLQGDIEGAREVPPALAAAGVSIENVADRLLDDGVGLFVAAYDRLIGAVAQARAGVSALPAARAHVSVEGRGSPAGPGAVLAGDVGGTKTLLALCEAGAIRFERRYRSHDYATFDELLTRLVADAADALGTAPRIRHACLGVAGPVTGERVALTNLPWRIDADAIAARFGIGRVHLINDFAASAHGLDALGRDDLATLQAGEPLADGARVLIGAGTGLGVAYLLPDRGAARVVAGEGGHAGFAPADDDQASLWRSLRAQFGRVEVEHVVSGPGLARIYAHLRAQHRFPPSPALERALGEHDPAAAIATFALEHGDRLAGAALDLFIACLGAVAGDHALNVLARGGVYVTGGIAPKILERLRGGGFVAAFADKGAFSDLARRMPVHVVLNERIGLLGAARVASAA